MYIVYCCCRPYGAKKTARKTTKYAKKPASIYKKIAKLSRAVRAARPELKWFRTGGNFTASFAEYNSSTGDGAQQAISFLVPQRGLTSSDRIGNQIQVRKIEMSVGVKSTNLLFNIDYKIYVVLHKEKLASSSLSLAQINTFLEPDLYTAASNQNASTNRSRYHPDYRKDWQVLKVITGRAVPPNTRTDSGGAVSNTQWYKEHICTIGKNFIQRFDKNLNTGNPTDITDNSLHMILVAGNESDTATSNTCIQLRKVNMKIHFTDD